MCTRALLVFSRNAKHITSLILVSSCHPTSGPAHPRTLLFRNSTQNSRHPAWTPLVYVHPRSGNIYNREIRPAMTNQHHYGGRSENCRVNLFIMCVVCASPLCTSYEMSEENSHSTTTVHSIRLLNWSVVRMYHLSTQTNGLEGKLLKLSIREKFCDTRRCEMSEHT